MLRSGYFSLDPSLGALDAVLGSRSRSFRRSFGGFDLDLGFVGQSVSARGHHFVAGRDAIDNLHVVAVADAEFDRLLVGAAIATRPA